MNIYDKKILRCSNCENFIGEIDWDSKVVFSICGKCDRLINETSKNKMYIKNELVPKHKQEIKTYDEKVIVMT